jgi:glutaredoxin
MKITVYSRPGCHLCDEALAQIESLVDGRDGVSLEVIDIESDDTLFKRYLERIPVVEAGGEVVSEVIFDPGPLRAAMGIA